MIGMRLTLDTRDVRRAVRRTVSRTKTATAQELNTQRRQSRTRMVRYLSVRLGVKPQRRLRRRIILPRGGRATPRRLYADGLSLVEAMPGRYFTKGNRGRGGGFTLTLPGGTREMRATSESSKPFRVQTGPVLNVFRRRGASRLPIQTVHVDTSRPGYAVRDRVLAELAREWPGRWQGRMRRELRRAWGA